MNKTKQKTITYHQRTPHPSLIQRIQNLEQKNRHLQFCLKQQQQYTESIMQRKCFLVKVGNKKKSFFFKKQNEYEKTKNGIFS